MNTFNWIPAAGLCCMLAADCCAAGGELLDPAIERKIDALLAAMTLEQKVAQMIQGEIQSVTPEDLRRYGLGSVLNGGGSFPGGDKRASRSDWLALADSYHLASRDTSGGNAGIPVIWGTDAVHGHNNVLGATLYPHNIGLGAAGDAALVRAIGELTAREVAATGLDWIFAPTLAVVKDDRWGRTYEGYSDRPAMVASLGAELVRGIQSAGIIATAKHFVGDGGTLGGVDQGDTLLPLEELLEEHGRGYQAAISAGVLTVMVSFNSWNGDKVHGQRQLLTEVLKGRLGFQGLVLSDWNGIGQVPGCSNSSCPQAIEAGIDMLMAPEDWRALLRNTLRQVESGEIGGERIDDAVRRILRVKFLAGAMDAPRPSLRQRAGEPGLLGHREHRALAREAVRKSLVLLKNRAGTLPLDPRQHILVAGRAADDIGRQSGGWTLSWQGTGNRNADFPHGASLYDGIRERVAAAGGRVTLANRLVLWDKPDAAVVVFGEHPYAEGRGDLSALRLARRHEPDYRLMRQLSKAGVPVVAVLLTGRPLWVARELEVADSFVVAWLPGGEGGGVADVLFTDAHGALRHDFEGRLSYGWPARATRARDPLLPVAENVFGYGYGLDYRTPASGPDAPAADGAGQ